MRIPQISMKNFHGWMKIWKPDDLVQVWRLSGRIEKLEMVLVDFEVCIFALSLTEVKFCM